MSAPSPHDFVRWLVGSIVDQPDSLALFQSRDGRHDLIEIRVAASDLPNVIGRGGRTAQSLRAVLDAWTWKHHLRAHLRILEEDEEPKGTLVSEGDVGLSDDEDEGDDDYEDDDEDDDYEDDDYEDDDDSAEEADD